MRVGIRLKLLLLSLFLFAIPWLGYQYVWEVESYLRQGQEQTMVGTARAVATALHERPALFDQQAAYLRDIRPGTDLYAHKISQAIRLDGDGSDWQAYQSLLINYGAQHVIDQRSTYRPQSLSFKHMVGQYQQYLYALFEVTDEQLVFRPRNSLRVDRNDHLMIALTTPDGEFSRYVISPYESGWVNAYLLSKEPGSMRAIDQETRIQGYWRETASGYTVELRFPVSMLSTHIAFAIADVDDTQTRSRQYVIGTADPAQSSSLGTVLVPSPEIENILQGLRHSNARVWVVDKHFRVLARSGSIQSAVGIRANTAAQDGPKWWQYVEKNWLLPLYYQILTRPPADFVDELEDAYSLKGSDLEQALQGTASSLWRLSADNKAVILSASHPIFLDDQVMGAVIVEQTTHGIRTLRNRALEQLFHVILGVVVLGSLALFVFASRISFRIRKLRNQTEAAIDQHGKILSNITPSTTRDEIGDLSRTFYNVLDKLGQYNRYLENMSSRLSHELRTPVAIVNSSLENLAMLDEQDQTERDAYIGRAQQGIRRLSRILANMSEATRLEQAIAANERERFNVAEVVAGCAEGYRAAYPQCKFDVNIDSDSQLLGAPELFAQMLDKIIANAVEFHTPDTAIRMSLHPIANQLVLQIENDGPALPENMQDQLINSMVSVRKQVNGQETHLGLGLYIARLIAEYHQGHISLHNLPDDKGVNVTVRLPRMASH